MEVAPGLAGLESRFNAGRQGMVARLSHVGLAGDGFF